MRRLIFCAVVVLVGGLATVAHADFILWNDEQITVNSFHMEGNLYDTSRADIVAGGEASDLKAHDSSTVDISGGSIRVLYAYDQSTVTMSSGTMASLVTYNGSRVEVNGGTVTVHIGSYNESTVDISGGSVGSLYVEDSSTVNISEGSVADLRVRNSGTVDISGGSVPHVQVTGNTTLNISGGTIDGFLGIWDPNSIVTLNVKDYRLGGGLTLEGERLLGTGILSGEWMDDTPRWFIDIATNSGAGIFISQVSEPYPGDANLDGVTDLSDFNIWNANKFTSDADWTTGDFDGDGTTDLSDFNIWNAHKFTVAQGGAAPAPTEVPEPGTLLLACIAAIVLRGLRRRVPHVPSDR